MVRWILGGLVLVIVIGCVVLVQSGTSSRELRHILDGLAVPSDMHIVQESAEGNELCLDQCAWVGRIYSSPLSGPATYGVFVDALTRSGFHCTAYCSGFDASGRGLFTDWTNDRYRIGLVVESATDPQGITWLSTTPAPDDGRTVYVTVTI